MNLENIDWRIVAWSSNQYVPGEPGFAKPHELAWSEDLAYPISRLADAPGAQWFDEEVRMWAQEGQPERYDDMLTEPIREHIIVYDDANRGWIWDGNHRTGSRQKLGIATIKAYVGRRIG